MEFKKISTNKKVKITNKANMPRNELKIANKYRLENGENIKHKLKWIEVTKQTIKETQGFEG